MRHATGIALGLTMFLFSAARMAVGDEPPVAYRQLDQRLHYSDLVCSATIDAADEFGEARIRERSQTPEERPPKIGMSWERQDRRWNSSARPPWNDVAA